MKAKGSPKTPGSGRKKGSLNKNRLPLKEKAEELGIDPFEILLFFAQGDWEALGYESMTEKRYSKTGEVYEVRIISADNRVKAASDACQYMYPKLRHTDAFVKRSPVGDRPLIDISDEELESISDD